MKDIRDQNGELLRHRIPSKDLFEIQKRIVSSDIFSSYIDSILNKDRLLKFVYKGLIDNHITNKSSAARTIYLVNVLCWHMKNNGITKSILVTPYRAWMNIYMDYAIRYNVHIYPVSSHFPSRSELISKLKRRYKKFYVVGRNFRSVRMYNLLKFSRNNHCPHNKNQIYIDGRGDINLKNNGDHSDFFWYFNSSIDASNISYKYNSSSELSLLNAAGINAVSGYVCNDKTHMDFDVSIPNKARSCLSEYKELDELIGNYNMQRYYWTLFFEQYNVKVYLTWYKNKNDHIAITDAINSIGGISALYQMSFIGMTETTLHGEFDVSFVFSNFSYGIDAAAGSNIKYHVITGYIKDYAKYLVHDRARVIRENLLLNGAKNIVLVLDENSADDSRWHTGHFWQRENYSYILNAMLQSASLGVIFKPKHVSTLRQRLGHKINLLLDQAIETGRCYLYEDSGRHTTIASPVLAAMSSDLAISAHLDGGTAALECALAGVPTLLIDREGTPQSKLSELPKNLVVFDDWTSTINAVMEHLSTPGGIDGFGDWSSIINELDPFRDGKAAHRMGTYLHWLIQGYEKGLDKDQIMLNAAERYKEEWGADKVIYG